MSSAQGANPTSLVPFEQDATPTTLPPPYTGPTRAEEDADVGDEEYDDQQPPPLVHINASTTIQGSNNIIPSVPLETAHILATVMATLRRYNPQVVTGNVQVRIDRGVNIVGDRNVVGVVGIRPRQPVAANYPMAARVAATATATATATTTAAAAAAARKRKPEEQSDGAPEAKRISRRASSCPPC